MLTAMLSIKKNRLTIQEKAFFFINIVDKYFQM